MKIKIPGQIILFDEIKGMLCHLSICQFIYLLILYTKHVMMRFYSFVFVALLLDQQAKWEIIKEEGSRLPAEVELFWCSSNA